MVGFLGIPEIDTSRPFSFRIEGFSAGSSTGLMVHNQISRLLDLSGARGLITVIGGIAFPPEALPGQLREDVKLMLVQNSGDKLCRWMPNEDVLDLIHYYGIHFLLLQEVEDPTWFGHAGHDYSHIVSYIINHPEEIYSRRENVDTAMRTIPWMIHPRRHEEGFQALLSLSGVGHSVQIALRYDVDLNLLADRFLASIPFDERAFASHWLDATPFQGFPAHQNLMDLIVNRHIFLKPAKAHEGWQEIQDTRSNYIRMKLRPLHPLVAADIIRLQLPWAALDEGRPDEDWKEAVRMSPVPCTLKVIASFVSGTMLVLFKTTGRNNWAYWGQGEKGTPMEGLHTGATLFLEFTIESRKKHGLQGIVTERDAHKPSGAGSIRQVRDIKHMKLVVLTEGCPPGLPGIPGVQEKGVGKRPPTLPVMGKGKGKKGKGFPPRPARHILPLPATWLKDAGVLQVTMVKATRVRQGIQPAVWQGLSKVPEHRIRQAYGAAIPDAPCARRKLPVAKIVMESLAESLEPSMHMQATALFRVRAGISPSTFCTGQGVATGESLWRWEKLITEPSGSCSGRRKELCLQC
jgi:hypothetical protein